MIKKINWVEEFNKVIEENKLVLVDFWAEWCGPCQMLGPILEDLDSKGIEWLVIAKVNVDENPDLAAHFRVMSIPTMLLVKDWNVIDSSVGVKPVNELEKWIKSVA